MRANAKGFQPFENHFKLDVIFSNFHKYLINQFQLQQIGLLKTIDPHNYNNLQGTPSSDCK
jgi:hypothetical protein